MQREEQPQWARDVIARRESFQGAAFVLTFAGGGEEVWKFIYAVQQPYYLALARLNATSRPFEAVPVTSDNWGDLFETAWMREFKCNFADMVGAHELPDVAVDGIQVLQRVEFVGGTKVVAREPPISLARMVATCPVSARAGGDGAQPRESKSSGGGDDLISRYPWLQKTLDAQEGFGGASTASKRPRLGEGDGADHDFWNTLSDADLELEMERLHRARAEVAHAHDFRHNDFGTRVLGGPSTMERFGIPYDAIQGYSRTKEGEDFCLRWGLQRSMRFGVREFGDVACGVLARAWCHRHSYFFNAEIADAAISPDEGFPDAVRAAYGEPSELRALSEGASAALLRRIEGVRDVLRG